jgi:hypothetical protein
MTNKHILPLILFLGVSVTKADPEFKKLPEVPTTSKEIASVLGVASWSAMHSIPAGANRQVMVYAKQKGKPAVLLVDGPVIRNDQGENYITRRVVVAIDGLAVRPWRPKLKVGVGVSVGSSLMIDTVMVSNPIPKNVLTVAEQFGLMLDREGKMLLVQGNSRGMTAYPGVNGQEYAIYLILEKWSPKQ